MSPTSISLTIDPGLSPCPARIGLVWASGLAPIRSGGALPASLAAAVEHVGGVVASAAAGGVTRVGDTAVTGSAADPLTVSDSDPWPDAIRERVRRMLRHGHYKPSGRAKPASEFLLRAARAGELQAINGPVDVNNAISLRSGLPASIFDLALTGPALLVRRGQPGESYVFNGAGQAIDLQDLLLVCRRQGAAADPGAPWEPCGNPVKDAMITKIRPDATRAVAGVIYAPVDMAADEVRHWAERFALLLRDECGAAEVGSQVVG